MVLAFLAIHLIQFWAKMQLAELTTHELSAFPMDEFLDYRSCGFGDGFDVLLLERGIIDKEFVVGLNSEQDGLGGEQRDYNRSPPAGDFLEAFNPDVAVPADGVEHAPETVIHVQPKESRNSSPTTTRPDSSRR